MNYYMDAYVDNMMLLIDDEYLWNYNVELLLSLSLMLSMSLMLYVVVV